MKCCGHDLPDGAKFCPYCGKKAVRERGKKKRGNGTGSVYQLPSGKWRGAVEIGSYLDDDGKFHRLILSTEFPSIFRKIRHTSNWICGVFCCYDYI